MKIVVLILLISALVAVVSLAVMGCSAQAPRVQLVEGKLRPCPGTPNCVSSESESESTTAAIAPLAFSGDSAAAWERAGQAAVAIGGRIQSRSANHLWATFTSRLFRFVDDLELRLDEADRVIHVRSASRVGRSDLGVNRKRVERLRQQFQTTATAGDTP